MSEPGRDPTPPLAFEHFVNRVGESFPATTSTGEVVALLLIDAVEPELRSNVAPGFSLDFRIRPEDGPHPQQLFALEHPDAGTHLIFLAPVGRDERGTIYQSVFSFLPGAEA